MTNVLDVLRERGFVEATTDDEAVGKLLEEPATCYIGFDPTAPSLHAGSLEPIMSLVHMQRCGHRPIVLVGGGTGLVGDPSGKTEMRKVMSVGEVDANADALKRQLSRYLDFSQGKALLLNNADWLGELKYIEFLRDVGRHFSVNRMLAAESYRLRMEQESGLNFIEFNYMLLQAYDFWHLWKHHGCRLQMGGADQWGNICAGIDLTRRLGGPQLFGITFPLLTTRSGAKMGKTATGAVWLDPERTSPYEFYQYWINVDDQDVERFLALFTFLPMQDVRRLGGLGGEGLREAKEILAFEATKITHSEEEARAARDASRRLFQSRTVSGGEMQGVPTTEVDRRRLEEGVPGWQLLEEVGLTKSRAEARRLIQQGGAYVNERRLEAFDEKIGMSDMEQGSILLRAGKKRFHRVKVREP
ncbi:MAG: tyrosine--tRNA ligase [bacterium]